MDGDPGQERGLLGVCGGFSPLHQRLQHALYRPSSDHQSDQPADGEDGEQDVLDVPFPEQRGRGDDFRHELQPEERSEYDATDADRPGTPVFCLWLNGRHLTAGGDQIGRDPDSLGV